MQKRILNIKEWKQSQLLERGEKQYWVYSPNGGYVELSFAQRYNDGTVFCLGNFVNCPAGNGQLFKWNENRIIVTIQLSDWTLEQRFWHCQINSISLIARKK